MERIGKTKEECCEDLANAIITQAANDYRTACQKFKSGNGRAKREIKMIEAFFHSEWCDFLCQGSATDILKRLQQEQGVEP